FQLFFRLRAAHTALFETARGFYLPPFPSTSATIATVILTWKILAGLALMRICTQTPLHSGLLFQTPDQNIQQYSPHEKHIRP
ncbi:MAG: hypothetical protein ABGX68_05745, partial [Methylococcales bacterium]